MKYGVIRLFVFCVCVVFLFYFFFSAQIISDDTVVFSVIKSEKNEMKIQSKAADIRRFKVLQCEKDLIFHIIIITAFCSFDQFLVSIGMHFYTLDIRFPCVVLCIHFENTT